MEYPTKNLSKNKPTPKTTMGRRLVDWTKFSNENLKFILDVLSLHCSPYEVEVANEIERRIMADTWLDLEKPPPPLENIPNWLKRWPFCRLWSQDPRRSGGVVEKKNGQSDETLEEK